MTIFFKSYTEIQDELHYVSIFEVIFVQTKTTFRNKMHIVMICRLIVKSVKLTTFSFDRFCVILIDGKRTRKWIKQLLKKGTENLSTKFKCNLFNLRWVYFLKNSNKRRSCKSDISWNYGISTNQSSLGCTVCFSSHDCCLSLFLLFY